MDINSLNYTILKSICKLTEREDAEYEKRVDIIKWGNNGEPKLEIRTWQRLSDGTMVPCKGIGLNRKEAERLRIALNFVLKPREKIEGEKEKPGEGGNADGEQGQQADG